MVTVEPAVPRSLLQRQLGSPRRQIAAGVLVSVLLALPVEWRLVTQNPFRAFDEAVVSLLALAAALLAGAVAGMTLPTVAARRGFLEQLLVVPGDPRKYLVALRSSIHHFMLPHWLAIFAARLLLVLAQPIFYPQFQFSAFMQVGLSLPETGWPPGEFESLFVATLWSWLALALVPFFAEGAVWIAIAFHLSYRMPRAQTRLGDFSVGLGWVHVGFMAMMSAGLFMALAAMSWFAFALPVVFLLHLGGLGLSLLPAFEALHALALRQRVFISVVAMIVCLIPGIFLARGLALNYASTEVRRLWGWRGDRGGEPG